MSTLADDILQAAKESRRPRPGDIVFIIRRTAVAPGNIPDIEKLITRCRIVREQTNGARVLVLNPNTGMPEEGDIEGAFIDRKTHAILTTRAAALEYAAQLVGDVLDVLAVMRQRAADVLEQLNDQLNTEQSP